MGKNILYMTANYLLGQNSLPIFFIDYPNLSDAWCHIEVLLLFHILMIFFLCELKQDMCLNALNTRLNLLSLLGFLVSWSKVEGPSQRITFLGIEIDSTCMELRLPNTKLCEFKRELTNFRQLVRASKIQLQSLVGKLNWASAVVHGRRVFLHRIINSFSGLTQDWHKMWIQGDLLADINWWHNLMSSFNGKSLILNNNHITSVTTDACTEGGWPPWFRLILC
jgi:hypothetical protein